MELATRAMIVVALCLTLDGSGNSTPRAAAPTARLPEPPYNPHILVDQFGYRPADRKVAVIRDPRVGFDSADRFTPGAQFQVRRASDSAVVFTGAPVPWRAGAVDLSSGDAGWRFDFSSLQEEGTY